MIGLIIGLLVVAALAVAGCKTVRASYESAPYHVVRADGQYEVRDYPALTIVETPMASVAQGADGSFNRLFRFITGGNDAHEKIAMTTPVFMAGSASNRTMAFVMPAKMTTTQVPKPVDAQLAVRELPPGRFAVWRFNGRRSGKNEAEALGRLQARMAQEQLPAESPPVYAYFDPPWTPGFLRRNEVMIRTDSEKR